MTAWAFSTLRHYHPELFTALLEQLAAQLDSVEPQNVANSLWAFARVGHPLGDHNDALVSAAKRLLPRMNQQELCNTVWALGVLGQLDTHTWEQFCHCAGNVQGGLAGLPSCYLYAYWNDTAFCQGTCTHVAYCLRRTAGLLKWWTKTFLRGLLCVAVLCLNLPCLPTAMNVFLVRICRSNT